MSAKRKMDDGDEANTHGSTLFVSNLSYTTTTESLQAAFDDLAPVRSCFVVYEKSSQTSDSVPGEPKSKGVGYVTFAVKEDAESIAKRFGAQEEGGSESLLIDGRKVRVKWADRKPTAPNEPSSEAPPAKKPRKEPRVPRTHVEHDPAAIRTLVISNLSKDDLTKNVLWKKIRKYDGAESVEWPVSEDSTVAHAIFKTPAAATAALPKLHSHLYKGTVLSVVLKKRSDSLIKAGPTTSSKKAGPSRGGRLIVRNIPWNITPDDLRAVFTPFGPLHSVHVPVKQPEPSENPDDTESINKRPPLAKGFAFVWFLSKQDAEKAIQKANGMKLYAGYAADKATAAAHKIAGRKEIVKKKNDDNARVIAVDWALSKERWKEANAAAEAQNPTVEADEEEELKIYDGDDSDEGEPSGTASDDGSDSDSGGSRSDQSMHAADDNDDEGSSQRNGPPPPEEGTTLFVRNVPFEATDDDLKELFRSFGPLRYARVTMDHDSGRSRGTGFVCFWNLEDADACVEEADRVRVDLDPELNAKKNPFSMLTLDPSSSRAARLVLQGRTLDVTRAVSRERAEKLRETGERVRERKDKRNLYLMREGVIFASTPSASTLTKAELERRQQSFNTRRALLRSNPSLYISRTRLSIRNLPIWASERILKRLAVHAIRAFEDEVGRGERTALAVDELEPDPSDLPPAVEEESAKKPNDSKGRKSFWKKTERKTGVKQAKIVRQADRVDTLTGKGRSKGYGFLELERHEDALRVLRWANNNQAAQGLMWNWSRDEIEDLLERGRKELKDSKDKLKKEEVEEKETRVKKLKERLEEMKSKPSGEGIKDGRTLHIEFSVENVQVVKRRSTKEETSRLESQQGGNKPHKNDPPQSSSKRRAENSEDPASPPTKKKRVSFDASKPQKPGNVVGSLIGKKRKERKKKAGN